MIRICPMPIAWDQVFKRLTQYARGHVCNPRSPPTPLILNGWVYSNDVNKMERWAETVAWAKANGCAEIVNAMADSEFYFVEQPSTYMVGPPQWPDVPALGF